MSRKRKEKKEKKAADDKDNATSQANLDKIVMPLRLYNRLEQNK